MNPSKSSASNLQLNPIHNDLIKQFLELTRYQLAQRLKSVRHSFSNLLTFKVRDNTTYDGDEVRDMLIGLQEIVIDEIETELRDSNYTSTLLIQKLLKTAEEWHLTLSTTISDLEDREKLNTIKEFDEQLRKSPDKMTITVVTQQQAIPCHFEDDEVAGNESRNTSIAYVLKEKVTKLTQENELLKSKINELEIQLQEATLDEPEDEPNNSQPGPTFNEKQPPKPKKTIALLSIELAQSQKETESLRTRLNQLTNSKESDLESIQESVQNMRHELVTSRTLAETQTEQLRQDLEARENKLRAVQSHLLLKEKELEQKFQSTSVYINMKKILVQKNCTIKELRQKLVDMEGSHRSVSEAERDQDQDLDLEP